LAEREDLITSKLLIPEEVALDAVTHEGAFFGSSRREGFLASTIIHLVIFIVLIVKPDLLDPAERKAELLEEQRTPLVMMLNPPAPAPAPLVVPALPPPPQSQNPSRMVIPKATKPAPPDKRQDFQTDLPFSEGNADEFVTDKELKDPGEEGEPGESDSDTEGPGKDDGFGESKNALADLLPKDGFTFRRPTTAPPPQPPPAGGNGQSGERGERGPFEDIRRFLQDKQFHNPEGGLVTGRDNTLYYDDKGANFVPWIRRMLAEVRRVWIAGIPYSAAWRYGHVAVAVSVDRNGDINALEVMIPSGTRGFDNIAVGALRAADLLPLPPDYPDGTFEFILVFWYNERPYDLF
jgi:TonB family protein